MGTHKKGPSMTSDGDNENQMTLEKWIKDHPSALGDGVLKRFGGLLPFLFKVLSVNKGLSIQVCHFVIFC
jgi:mannose-6-phosphate isomerase